MGQMLFTLPAEIGFSNAEQIRRQVIRQIKNETPQEMVLDGSAVQNIDTAGVALIDYLQTYASQKNIAVSITSLPDKIVQAVQTFSALDKEQAEKDKKPAPGYFERLGDFYYRLLHAGSDLAVLLSNITYWGVVSFIRPKLRRRGEVIHQSILIGVNALPIIALIAFLIGFILALQSAAQLRQFGANIFVADLVAVAMVSEMGPLITAIMVSGRSGSAIAAEIATMVVTEEIDALKVMGIDPIPYLYVPKMLSITLVLPMLTLFANLIGIIGGMVIAFTYLDLDIIPFFNEVLTVLRFKELATSLIKSIVFAVIIVTTAIYFGQRVKGGAEGVGKATTASVVFSIFLVIVADSILGLVFYFGESTF